MNPAKNTRIVLKKKTNMQINAVNIFQKLGTEGGIKKNAGINVETIQHSYRTES